MGEALSHPEDAELDEGQLLSQLIQLLSLRPGQSVPLSDLSALVPGRLRQAASGRGGLRGWLQSWPAIIRVSGDVDREVVTLTLGVEHGDLALQLQHPQPSGCSAAAADGEGKEPRPPGGASDSEATRAPSELATLSSGTTPVSPAGWAEVPKQEEAVPFDEEVDGQRSVLLRGLPFKATVEDIRRFLGDFASALAGENAVHLALNRDGRPSGFARVQFVSAQAAERCRDGAHLRCMEDRYVEVFLYSDRPHKGRQKLVGEDGVMGSVDAWGGAAATSGGTRELVAREVRVAMAEPKNRCQLLSMLGVALSPKARAYLKQADQGLKHFLAQFPSEFSVDGAKGSEHVTYTPAQISGADGTAPCCTPIQLSEVLALPEQPLHLPFAAMEGYAVAVGEAAATASVGSSALDDNGPPSARSPGQEKVDPDAPASAASAGCHFATPSPWASPAPAAWGSMPWQPAGSAPPPPWPVALGAATAEGWGMPAPWHMPPLAPPEWPPEWPPPPLLDWNGFAPPGMPDAMAAAALAAAQETSQGAAAPPPTSGEHAAAAPLRLRGLPFTSSEQDVLAFFAQHDIVELIADGPKAVTLLLRSNGRPTGQAVVQMRGRADADVAQQVLHGQWMGNRYIEVFPHVEDGSAPGAGGCGGAPGGKDPSKAAGGCCPDADVSSGGTSAATTAGDGAGSAASQADHGNAGTPFPFSPALPPWAAVGWPGAAPSPAGAAADPSWDALFEFLGQDPAAAAQVAAMAGRASAA